jgi:hypothetical protein
MVFLNPKLPNSNTTNIDSSTDFWSEEVKSNAHFVKELSNHSRLN